MGVEELKALKEIVVPVIAGMTTVVTAVLAYMQSKCRRDLDIAYGEIRALKGGKRLIRKRGQFWKPKAKRAYYECPKGIDKE